MILLSSSPTPSSAELPLLGPAHVDLDLTNACNLGCTHCHSASGKPLPGEFNTAQLCDAIDQLHALGTMTLTVAGGEPFVRRDAVDILEHACRLPGWTVTAITNGTLLTEALLDQLVSRCPGLHVNVSIDGSTPDRFAVLRHYAGKAPGSAGRLFDRVGAAARAVVAHGLPLQINFTLAQPTAHDLADTYRLAIEEIEADGMLAIKFFSAGYGLDQVDKLEFDYPSWACYFADLTHRRLAGDFDRLAISVSSPWEFYLPLIDAGDIDIEDAERKWGYKTPLKELTYASSRDVADTAGIAHLSLRGDGTVYPAVLMAGNPKMTCGDLREQSLEEIWFDSEPLIRLRELRAAAITGSCGRCEHRGWCGGGSRARALALLGDASASDALCPLVA